MRMMKTMLAIMAVALVAVWASPLRAADEKTITGEGKCAKCELKETKECQNVVEVKDGDKTVKYYLTGAESKKFHENLCKAPAQVKVTGKVHEKDGKTMMTVSKIELVK